MIGEKIIAAVLDKGLGIIDKFVPDKDLKETLAHQFNTLITTQDHDLEELALEVERDVELAHQATIQAELHQNDQYTKRTRPMLARQSWYGSLGYVATSVMSNLIPAIPILEIEWQILTLLASPVLTYMGVRSLDKWKKR